MLAFAESLAHSPQRCTKKLVYLSRHHFHLGHSPRWWDSRGSCTFSRSNFLSILELVNLVHDDIVRTLREVPQSLSVSIRIYVTGSRNLQSGTKHQASPPESDTPATSAEKVVSLSETTDSATIGSLLYTTVYYDKRPDIASVIEEAHALAQGQVAVVGAFFRPSLCGSVESVLLVCGPKGMAAQARSVLRSSAYGPTSVYKGAQNVSLFIENFGY